MVADIIFQAILWIWFFGSVVTYKFGKHLLVEGEGIKSVEFIMLSLYSVGIALYYIFPAVGRWILFSILVLWFVTQFMCHWYYTIFGASKQKLKGYNTYFKDTIHLFPISEKRLVPDLYHIILHIFILTNIIFCIL